jgi:hypothetical protein
MNILFQEKDYSQEDWLTQIHVGSDPNMKKIEYIS